MTADEFNSSFPVGTRVAVLRNAHFPLITRTRGIAWTISGVPVVAVENIVGVVELSQVTAVTRSDIDPDGDDDI